MEKEKGITLVVLVITVVIMLILAGVAIAAVVDGDGIFNRTRRAAETYNEMTEVENVLVHDLINQIDVYMNGIDVDNIQVTIGTIVNENKTFDGQSVGSYNNPIIPKGFAPINENGAIWGTEDGYQKGLVIRDGNGNEFVWVPVDGKNVKFERYDFGKSEDGFSVYSETVPKEITLSISQNGGFYIARFEAGQPFNEKPVSKQWVAVYNNVDYETAKILAETMYSVTEENYGIISTLIYGTQWDTVLKFIAAYNIGELGYNTYATNSIAMGNYSDTNDNGISELAVCGSKDMFRQKNIYDMAGNIAEWTMEKSRYGSSYYGTSRGGYYSVSSTTQPAAYRDRNGSGTSISRISSSIIYKVTNI